MPEELGLFQLENLAHVPTRFVFYDLRVQPSDVHPVIDAMLKRATRLTVDEALVALRTVADRAAPVVLLCERGERSASVAAQLETLGFTNVYVVAGGVAGLVSEL